MRGSEGEPHGEPTGRVEAGRHVGPAVLLPEVVLVDDGLDRLRVGEVKQASVDPKPEAVDELPLREARLQFYFDAGMCSFSSLARSARRKGLQMLAVNPNAWGLAMTGSSA